MGKDHCWFALGTETASFLFSIFLSKIKRYSERPDPCGNAQNVIYKVFLILNRPQKIN